MCCWMAIPAPLPSLYEEHKQYTTPPGKTLYFLYSELYSARVSPINPRRVAVVHVLKFLLARTYYLFVARAYTQ